MSRNMLFVLGCLMGTLAMTAQDSPRWMSLDDTLRVNNLLQLAWENPAVNQFSRTYGESYAGGGFDLRDENGDDDHAALDVQRGNYSRFWNLSAGAHIKHGSSALWGHAKYENGFTRNATWNETSDLDMVYPYVLADSLYSARMKTEQYSFGGGYADNNGKLYWGAYIDYIAGLHYRNSDPRPRNVTANLNVTAGIGLNVWHNYMAAASLNFKKYKQTNNVAFYSELGHDKLYHLTGLSNDYGRFAGTGEASYYNGYRWGVTLNLHPLNSRGVSASVNASRFAFDNILTTLNKLPLAHVTHNAIDGELGWLQRNWGVRATMSASRRVGTDNVFGDASASVYPEIGSNDMYHENRFNVGIDGLWSSLWSCVFKTDLHPFVSYRHLNEIYADPQCRRLLNEVEWGTRLRADWHKGRFMPGILLGVALTHPLQSELHINGVKDEFKGLQRAMQSNFDYLSGFHWQGNAMLALQVAVNHKQAVRLNGGVTLNSYRDGLKTVELAANAAYIF